MSMISDALQLKETSFLTDVGVCGHYAPILQMGLGGLSTNPRQWVVNQPPLRVSCFQYSVDRLGRKRAKHAQTGGFMFRVGQQKTKPARNLKRKSQTLSLKGCATLGLFFHAH